MSEPIDWPAFIARLSFRSMFPIEIRLDPAGEPYSEDALVVILHAPDIHDGSPSRVFYLIPLSEMGDPVEALDRIRKTVLQAIRHELDECMLFDGRQIRDPHAKEPVGLRLVDRGITPLIDDAAAIGQLRQTIERRRLGTAGETLSDMG